MPRGVQINVEVNDSITELAKSWPLRMQRIAPQVAYLSADFLRRYILSKLPKSQAYRGYRAGLEVARIKGLRAGEYGYALQIDMTNSLVKKVRPNGMILEVHPKKRAAKAKPEVAILEQYNPWTFESIPFTPDRRYAVIITKRVRSQRVAEVTEERRRDRSEWASKLNKVGVRETSKDRRLKIPKGVSILPDVAMDALTLEFGMGGTKPKPAWRTGASVLARGGIRAITRDKKLFILPLTRLSDKMWQKWPIKTKHSISPIQARKYLAFQKKLGIRVQ